jgi:hypothetical protein
MEHGRPALPSKTTQTTREMEASRHPIEGRITELLSVAMPFSSSTTMWIRMIYGVDWDVRFFCLAARG